MENRTTSHISTSNTTASVVLLISEEAVADVDSSCNNGNGDFVLPTVSRESVVAHLDKSHVTVHTYPESHPDNDISTFRADIDVGTCGMISPLTALDYLISSCYAGDCRQLRHLHPPHRRNKSRKVRNPSGLCASEFGVENKKPPSRVRGDFFVLKYFHDYEAYFFDNE